MANGAILYYQVMVNTVFYTANQQFTPGHTYYVSPDIYNGKLDGDSRNFADLCASAVQLTSAP